MDELELHRAIWEGVSTPHQAAGIALQLYRFIQESQDDSKGAQRLAAKLVARLPAWGIQDLTSNQLAYAVQLASCPRSLEYEEMHKLFSLRDEISALTHFGLPADSLEIDRLEAALRERFSAQSRSARLVAEDRAEKWNRSWWWYEENLSDDDGSER